MGWLSCILKGTNECELGEGTGRMYYCITVGGHLDHCWSDWFGGFTITNQPDGTTLLWGVVVVDQAALYGLLVKIRDLGLPLIALVPDSAHGHEGAENDGM